MGMVRNIQSVMDSITGADQVVRSVIEEEQSRPASSSGGSATSSKIPGVLTRYRKAFGKKNLTNGSRIGAKKIDKQLLADKVGDRVKLPPKVLTPPVINPNVRNHEDRIHALETNVTNIMRTLDSGFARVDRALEQLASQAVAEAVVTQRDIEEAREALTSVAGITSDAPLKADIAVIRGDCTVVSSPLVGENVKLSGIFDRQRPIVASAMQPADQASPSPIELDLMPKPGEEDIVNWVSLTFAHGDHGARVASVQVDITYLPSVANYIPILDTQWASDLSVALSAVTSSTMPNVLAEILRNFLVGEKQMTFDMAPQTAFDTDGAAILGTCSYTLQITTENGIGQVILPLVAQWKGEAIQAPAICRGERTFVHPGADANYKANLKGAGIHVKITGLSGNWNVIAEV